MARLNRMFIALVVFSCSVVSSAYDSGQQRNVFDYYLKVPPQYLPFLAIDSKEARKSAVWIKDLENGYLQARQQGEEIYAALRLFRNPEGSDLIAIETRNCVRGCFSNLTFLTIAYELKSARACAVWARPIVTGQRLPDNFHGGSMFHTARTGVMTTFLGFNNEAHADQIRVAMADENLNEILTLFYNVEASWEGSLECPSFRVSCFSNSKDSGIPISCMVYPSGLRPDHRLTYNWTLSNGVITSGQGTTTIRIDTAGEENVTAMVQVIGLGPKCDTRASFRSTPAIISRPSK
jgi:hypothetical protein